MVQHDPSDNNTISNGVVATVEVETGGTLLDEIAVMTFKKGAVVVTATDYTNDENLIYTLLTTTQQLNSSNRLIRQLQLTYILVMLEVIQYYLKEEVFANFTTVHLFQQVS